MRQMSRGWKMCQAVLETNVRTLHTNITKQNGTLIYVMRKFTTNLANTHSTNPRYFNGIP